MLSLLVRLFLISPLCILAAGCEHPSYPWVDIPSSSDADYKLSFKTFKDSDSVAQPFHLGARSSRQGDQIQQILSAEQCKNVEVFQEKAAIVIFYDVLVLDHFSGDDHGAGVPRVMLCDNSNAICQSVKKLYRKQGVSRASICKLR